MRAIKQGDTVDLYYAERPEWYQGVYPYVRVEILSMPSDTGDHFYFRELNQDITFSQNPMDSNLGQIVLVSPFEELPF